jgi:uridine kinase
VASGEVAVPEIDPVAAVVAALADRTGTRWVGIDGKGASGKTTLAGRVAAALPAAVVVHNDDFARPDLPGWDRDRFVRQVLEPLLAGRPARYQRWDFDTDTGAEWCTVPVDVPVILEGVSATDVRLPVPWDFTIWVEVPTAVRRARIAEREGGARLDRWLTDWIPGEDAYVAAQRPQDRVDLVYVPDLAGS